MNEQLRGERRIFDIQRQRRPARPHQQRIGVMDINLRGQERRSRQKLPARGVHRHYLAGRGRSVIHCGMRGDGAVIFFPVTFAVRSSHEPPEPANESARA